MAEAVVTTAVPTVVVEDLHIVYKVAAGRGGNAAASLMRLVKRQPRQGVREVHAVRGVSFTAHRGEAIGVIGRNGSGKSTLLRAVAGLLPAASGAVFTDGQPSLLGVNAALMNDLSGDRTISLGCLAMGMTPQQTTDAYDRIVEFAGVEDFIETPVKRYSSGMNARLGFSIAAHLEPDVLIIDEVLAVGDHAFQTKAFARIKAMANAGAPVALVSHQLDKVLEICTKALLLERGAIRMAGSPEECVNEYLHGHGEEGEQADEREVGLSFSGMTRCA